MNTPTDNTEWLDEILLDFVRPKGQIIPYENGQQESAETAGKLLNYWLDNEARHLIEPAKQAILTHIDTVCREAVVAELQALETHDWGSDDDNTFIDIFLDGYIENRIAALTPPLNPNKDTEEDKADE